MELTNNYLESQGYSCNHPEKVLRTYRKSTPGWSICVEQGYLPQYNRVEYKIDVFKYDQSGVVTDKRVTFEHARTIEDLTGCLSLLGIASNS